MNNEKLAAKNDTDKPDATILISELRSLSAQIAATYDSNEYNLLTQLFVEKFETLDKLLGNNGTFPTQWVTKANQVQLKPYELNAHIAK